MSEEDLFEEYERNYIKEHTTSIKCYTEEAYNKLQQENKQLKEDKKKAIEYINKRMIHEGEYYFRKAKHFKNTEFGKDLLETLGGKE